MIESFLFLVRIERLQQKLSLTTNNVRERLASSKCCRFWLWGHEDLYNALASLHIYMFNRLGK